MFSRESLIPTLHLTRSGVLLCSMIVAYIALFSFVSLMRFYTFRTYIDLGIFDQAFSSTLKGHLFYETPDLAIIPSGSFLGAHFAPIVFLLLPVFALYPSPQTLLVLQTIFIAFGAIPIYLIALHILRRSDLSLALVGTYLMNPSIQSMNLFDFHVEAFLPFLLGMCLYFFLKKRWVGYFLFLSLSFMTIEFASIVICAMAVGILVTYRSELINRIRGRHGFLSRENLPILLALVTILLAIAEFYGALVIGAWFAGTNSSPKVLLGGFFPDFQQWIGAGFLPRITYWSILLGSTLYLPLKVPSRILMAAPWFIVTLVTSNGVYYAVGYQHGGAFVAPWLIVGLAYALDSVRSSFRSRRFLTLLFAGILLFCFAVTPLSPIAQQHVVGIAYEDGLPIPTAHDAELYQVIHLIPSNASILTQNNLFTQFSSRPDAYLYLPNKNTQVDYILGDSSTTWYTQRIFGQESVSQAMAAANATGLYSTVANHDGIILLQRN